MLELLKQSAFARSNYQISACVLCCLERELSDPADLRIDDRSLSRDSSTLALGQRARDGFPNQTEKQQKGNDKYKFHF